MYASFGTQWAEATFSRYEGIHLQVPRPKTENTNPAQKGNFLLTSFYRELQAIEWSGDGMLYFHEWWSAFWLNNTYTLYHRQRSFKFYWSVLIFWFLLFVGICCSCSWVLGLKEGFCDIRLRWKHIGLIHYSRAWPPGIWYKGTTTVSFYSR